MHFLSITSLTYLKREWRCKRMWARRWRASNGPCAASGVAADNLELFFCFAEPSGSQGRRVQAQVKVEGEETVATDFEDGLTGFLLDRE